MRSVLLSKSTSSIVRLIAIFGLVVTLAAGCTRPKRTDTGEGGSAEGGAASGQPVIEDKNIGTDPMGSDSGRIDGLNTIFFEYDQARLTADARAKLATNADWIKKNPNYTIQIEGHTDERGSVEYNLSLGERRAKSVKTYLEGLGVASNRMTIISYGEEKPIQSGDSESAWSKNRRANFVPLQ
jgi:peptidoglycan-associated lipoprotein